VDFSLKKNDRPNMLGSVEIFSKQNERQNIECGFFFKQNERQNIVSVDISSNKNERQKLQMWRKKMEDQHTASVDSSLNKIKDKTS